MLSVLSSFGSDSDSGNASLGWTIGRPILAAVLMTAVLPLAFILSKRIVYARRQSPITIHSVHFSLFCVVSLLSGLVAVAFWAGTSVLLGAFLAGICLALCPEMNAPRAFSIYVKPMQDYLLAPLFFASVCSIYPPSFCNQSG